jgi:MFS family permease
MTVSVEARNALIVLSCASILTLHVHTALAPALPNIIQFFNISYDLASWVLTAYMVTGAVMSIVIGRLADLYGAKRMFLIVIGAYTVGVALAPLSLNITTLLAIRVLQGVAVAVIPLGSKIVRDVYPDQKYVKAQGILTSMYSAGSVVGLVLGALVLQYFNWQGIFYTIIPFSVILLLVSWKFLPSRRPQIISKGDSGADSEKKKDLDRSDLNSSSLQRIDVKGAITLSVALVSLLLALSFAPFINSLLTDFILSLVVGLASLGLFIRIERGSSSPLVDMKVMSHRVIVLGNIALLIFGIVQYLIFQSVPILARNPTSVGGFGLNALEVGLLQLPFSLVIIVVGSVAGIVAAKIGATKLLIPGAAILVVGFLFIMLFHSTPEAVAINLIFFGMGSALFVTLDAVIVLFIPKAVMGTSAAVMNTMRIIGGSIGPIISGAIMQIFLSTVMISGRAQSFPNATAFNTIFFLTFILSIAVAAAIILVRNRATRLPAAATVNGKT